MTESLDLPIDLTAWPALADASVHAVDLGTGRSVAFGADRPWALASVVKLPWMVALHRAVDAGVVRLDERLTVDPRAATPGPTGVSAMHDPVQLSVRDAAYLALSHSDNASADAVLRRVGLDVTRLHCTALGLSGAARGSIRRMYDQLEESLPASTSADQINQLAHLRAEDVLALPVLNPELANVASARQLTALIAGIWADEVAPADGCATLRDALARPAAPGRIARGFASDDIAVAGKTGTLLTLRHEAAWVGLPDGSSYAVAVLTRVRSLQDGRAQDVAVGGLAVQAVRALRRSSP